MPTGLKNSGRNSVEHSTMVDAYRTGLAADLESLLAIFDGIEQSISAEARAKALCPFPRSIRGLVLH